MSIIPLVDSALGLASEIFKYINSKNATKYLDKMVSLKKEILEEEAKGYYSDDRLIEQLTSELSIVLEAVKQESIINSKKT